MSASDAPLPRCRRRWATGSRTRASVEFGGPSPSPKPARPTTRNMPVLYPLDADRPAESDLVRDGGGEVEDDLVVGGRGTSDAQRVGVERGR